MYTGAMRNGANSSLQRSVSAAEQGKNGEGGSSPMGPGFREKALQSNRRRKRWHMTREGVKSH